MTDINRTACTFSRPALNANTLKLIAVLAMVLDHAATVFLADTAPAALFFHAVGQIAAPIMCFFIAEGYTYTSNLKKYLLRLFIAAVISHVPYALCFKFTVWDFSPSRCGNGCARPFGCGCFCSGCAACSPTPQTGITSPCCGSSALPSFGKVPKSNGRFSGSSRFCMFCSISSTALRCPCG